MSSNNMILIYPSSERTMDQDVLKMYDLILKVVKKTEKRIFADFDVQILKEMPDMKEAVCKSSQNGAVKT